MRLMLDNMDDMNNQTTFENKNCKLFSTKSEKIENALNNMVRNEGKSEIECEKLKETIKLEFEKQINESKERKHLENFQLYSVFNAEALIDNQLENLFIKNSIDVDSFSLTQSEKNLIDRLHLAFYYSRKFNTLDLNLQKTIAILLQSHTESSLKKMSKVILANFIVQPVKRVITFAKLIPDFRALDINDQMSLLQGGSMEIFICSSSSLYDQMSNKFVNIVSKDRQIEGNDNSNIQLDILRLIWSEEIFEKTIMFLKSMSELKLDEATLILFLPLILFSPDRRDLFERSKILEIQSKYSFLLKKYIVWKYGMSKESLRIYNTLLLKLIELRTLREMHTSILIDADPNQLEPFPLAIISSERIEINRLVAPFRNEMPALNTQVI
jgi:hypothetical protein